MITARDNTMGAVANQPNSRRRGGLGALALCLFAGLPTQGAQAQAQDPFAPFFERSSRWQCRSKASYACGESDCRKESEGITILLDNKKKEYSRCDRRGCEPRAYTVTLAGLHTVISVEPHLFLKVLNDGAKFVEVTTLGMSTRLNFGACTVPGSEISR